MYEIKGNKTNQTDSKIYKVKREEKNTSKDSFTNSSSADDLFVNLKHLNELKETLTTPEGKKINIWAIYADPSVPGDRKSPYKHIGDEDEGLGCVDDVARAAVTYIKHFKYNNDPESLKMAKEALDFVMYMEAEDGQFYNFVFPDGSINKDGSTSLNIL